MNWALGWSGHSTLEAQGVYRMQLKREAMLLPPAERGGGVITHR